MGDGGRIGGGDGSGVDQADTPSWKSVEFAAMGVEELPQTGVGLPYQGRLKALASLAEGGGGNAPRRATVTAVQGLDPAQGVAQGPLGGSVAEDLSHVGPEGSPLAVKTLAAIEWVKDPRRNDLLEKAFQLTRTGPARSLDCVLQSGQRTLSAATAKILSEPR